MDATADWPAGPDKRHRIEIATLVARVCDERGASRPAITWGRRRYDLRAVEQSAPCDPREIEPLRMPALFSTGFYRPADARLHLSPGACAPEAELIALHEVAHHLTADTLPRRRRRGERRTVHGDEFWRTALDLYDAEGIDRDLVLLRQVLRSPAARRAWRERHGRALEPFVLHDAGGERATVADRAGAPLGSVWAQTLHAPPGMRWRGGGTSVTVWYGRSSAWSTMPAAAHRSAKAAAHNVALESLAWRLERADADGADAARESRPA